ncbi:MAG: acetyl-CoA C-acetyltransferase, partial [Actinomycetales bacterium]
GFGEQVAGVQLNRFCGSGLESVNQASARVKSGWEDLIVAGGVESMSRVPMASDGGAWAMDPKTALETDFVPQGIGADLIATLEGFSRTDVDTFAAESQARAAKAIANGYFSKSVIPVVDKNGLTILDHDEFVREGTTAESLSSLGASFAGLGDFGFDAVALEKYITVEKINHVHHAGNSSGIVDGASLVLIGNEKAGERHGLTPRARIVSTAVIGSEPTIMLTGPGPAARKALAKAGLQPDDIDLIEINEAFAAVAMKLMRDLDDYPHEQTNVNGGAIAMGHPLGATGGMILGTLVDELERREKRYGLATLCIGGGMGIATIVERI